MYVLGLKTKEIRLLKFEDVSDNVQPTIKVYRFNSGKVKQIEISKDLYEENKELWKWVDIERKYDETIRQATQSEEVVGHFMYTYSESAIIKKFKRNFGGILNKFNLRPKDIRELSLKEKNSGLNMIKEMSLIDNESDELLISMRKDYSKRFNQVKTNKKPKKKR